MEQPPCPGRIWMDCGAAFSMGCIGGGLWHGIKGVRNNPRGMKLQGMLMTMKSRAPATGGNFGAWGLLFSSFDCSLAHIRGVEDPINPILAGGLSGGLLQARQGAKSMGAGFVGGILILSLIEGIQFVAGRYFGAGMPPTEAEIAEMERLQQQQMQQMQMQQQGSPAAAATHESSTQQESSFSGLYSDTSSNASFDKYGDAGEGYSIESDSSHTGATEEHQKKGWGLGFFSKR